MGGTVLGRKLFGLPRWLSLTLGLPVVALAAAGVATAVVAWDTGRPSRCRGTVVDGSLEAGRRLPYSGENYRSYSVIGFLIGRTFMHGAVRDAIRDSYAELARQHPQFRYVYAESGWPWGGQFRPHKSHANGTAVDFMVPVQRLGGDVTEMSTWFYNLWGYAEDFDASGKSSTRYIDFEAMAAHLLALSQAARKHGISIRRVIFDPAIQPRLFASKLGGQLAQQVPFSKTLAWVRHDEHYHVDFNVPCR